MESVLCFLDEEGLSKGTLFDNYVGNTNRTRRRGMNSETEYSALRNEILNCITMQNNYIVAMYTISISILVFAFSQNDELIFLFPYLIIIPFQSIINIKRNAMIKLGVYIQVFLENENDWENVNILFEAENRKIDDKRIHNKLKRFVRRTGAVQIGFFCSLSAGIVHYMNLGIEFKEILSVSLRNSLVFIFALLLFGVVFLLNKTVWETKNVRESYLSIMSNIKEKLN